MKTQTETCTGTLHRDPEGRWYATTQLTGKAYLDAKLQDRPDPNLATDGVDVEVTLAGVGPTWTVTDYHFL